MAFNSSYGDWEFSWPYPRFIPSEYRIFGIAEIDDWGEIFGETGNMGGVTLFELENDGTDWKAYPRILLGQKTRISQISLATFGPSYVVSVFEEEYKKVNTFFVGSGFVPTADQENSSFYSNDFPPGICVCNFKGRCLVGGVKSNIAPWNDLGFSSVAWSAPGKMIFDPSINVGAGYIQLPLDDNKTGFIYSLKRLGDMVVAYGGIGVAGLKPYSTERASGFGVVETSQPGTKNGGMVGGDHHVHLYIDDRGMGWLVSGQMEFKMVGYKEFFLPMVESLSITNPIIISYMHGRKRFYISNNEKCYVLTEYGLYECHQLTTGVGLYYDQPVGFFSDTEDYGWRIKTGQLDFGLRALKTLEIVEVGGEYSGQYVGEGDLYLKDKDGKFIYDSDNKKILLAGGPMSVTTECKYNYYASDFTALPAKRINPTGFVFPQATSTEFRLKLSGREYRNNKVNLSYISMGVKLVDKRGIRRVYGNVSSGDA